MTCPITNHRITAALAAILFIVPITPALATPNHGHLHYMVGVRAYAGTRHAAMLYTEASAPGLDLELAHENAIEMALLADGILKKNERLQKEQSPEEAKQITAELTAIQTAAEASYKLTTELGNWIDVVLAPAVEKGVKAEAAPELQAQIAERSRELFAKFQAVLKAHKEAEKKLGIPVPPDPPAPGAPEPAATTTPAPESK